MSESAEPATVPGHCTYCGEWTADGVVVGEIERDAGAPYTLVRHPEHVGLRRVTAS